MTKRNFKDSLAAYEKVDASTRNAFWGKAILMAELSRYDEAAAHYRAARSLDPLSANIRLQDASNLVCAGRYTDAVLAIESARADLQATEIRIDWILPDLAYAYAKSDRPESANQIVDDWIDETEFYPPIAPVLALVGRREEAAAILEAIDEGNEYFPAAYSAVSVLLGDDDRALDYLEKIAKEAPSALFRFHCFEETRQLAEYSRYTRLLAELGFPENYR